MNATTKIIEQYNLTNRQWMDRADGVYLSERGWYIRKDGCEDGPWQQVEFAKEAAPEFFE